jgi:hypothetical protein
MHFVWERAEKAADRAGADKAGEKGQEPQRPGRRKGSGKLVRSIMDVLIGPRAPWTS